MKPSSSHRSLRELIGDGYVTAIHSAGHEILRRLFVTVRDRNWGEIAPTQFDSMLDEPRPRIRLGARHTSEFVDFEWQGSLNVDDDARRVHFAFEGKALRDMEVCRLGLIVLHPVDSMIGAQLTTVGPQGEQRLTVNRGIHPQANVDGVPGAMTEPFSQLTIERADFGRLVLRFEGDLFELEDQRNWGDASFKTYCTPLRLGFPRTVKAGTVIAQRLDVQFTPASASAPAPALVGVSDPEAGIGPAIGREWSGTALGNGPREDEPAWDHIHVDLARHESAPLRALLEAPATAKIQFGFEKLSAEWLALLREHRERIARLLLYGPGVSLPAASAVALYRDEFARSVGPEVPLLAATLGYFVEFNRGVPLDAAVSGIAFPLTATVHSDDAETVMGNVATIRDMAATARHLIKGPEVVIAPLALYYPTPATTPRFPRRLVTAWLAATVRHAAAAGVTSITLGADVLRAIHDGDHDD